MRKTLDRRTLPIDLDHMRMLHEEAIEQLDLMHISLESADAANGSMRDTLETMMKTHWQAHMDVLHLICLHDDAVAEALKNQGLPTRDCEVSVPEHLFGPERQFLLLLITALSRHHRRIWHIYGLRGTPMGDYLKDSLETERIHMAQLIAMIDDLLG